MEEGLQKKPCIKCLLKDIDPLQYETRIKKLIDLMDKSEKADDKEYDKRLQICSRCSYLKDAFCGACGCYVELRCVKKNVACPYDHW